MSGKYGETTRLSRLRGEDAWSAMMSNTIHERGGRVEKRVWENGTAAGDKEMK